MAEDTNATEQQSIDDYRRVEQFLADPAVKRAFQKVKDDITEGFRVSQTSAQRESLHAKFTALDALADELIRTLSVGQFALNQKTQRETREQAEAQRKAQRGGRR